MDDFPPPPPPPVLINDTIQNNILDPFFPPPPPSIAQPNGHLNNNGVYNQKINGAYISPYAENTLRLHYSPIKNSNNSDGVYQKINCKSSKRAMPLSQELSTTNNNGTIFTSKNENSSEEVDKLTNMLINNLNTTAHNPNFIGLCNKCQQEILGEESGCSALGNLYHIICFNCCICGKGLCGFPFYALDNKLYCEMDYMDTLEKCSACMRPITNRILRATGKPYHPSCFKCVVCGKCLDGIPFTLDATNQFHCIEDFHKRFAPKCAMCNELITPQKGESETIRIIAMEKSYHVDCYKCEDCNMPLTSTDADGGDDKLSSCYPLDGQILCRSCNAERINYMASETNQGTDL